MQVSRKPTLVCNVNAVPTYADGASSLTAVENCAESATTLIPQSSRSGTSIQSGSPNSTPTVSAQHPDNTIAQLVTHVRPSRSAYFPPSQLPIAPTPTTKNVTRAGSADSEACSVPRRVASLAATNVAIQVHIAYSSHMRPRYPRFASKTARSCTKCGTAAHENGGDGAA